MVDLQVNIFALNEDKTIADVIYAVPRDIPGIDRVRIMVIDDGSTDRTAELAEEAGAEVCRHGYNRGLGAAFASALKTSLAGDADIMLTVDGDGQFDVGQIPDLIAPILDGHADMVTCSRFLDPNLLPDMPVVKQWGNHVVAGMVSSMTGVRLKDVSCGFRAYNRECMVRLNLMGRFTYTHEAIMELVFKGFRVSEVPLAVRGVREFGQSRVASNVFRYGWRTLRIMIGTLLNHRPHHVFSALAAVSAVGGVALAIFGWIPFLMTGSFIKWAMFSGGFLLALAVLLCLFGLQARTMHRTQFLLENLLYEQRLQQSQTQRVP